MLDYCDSLWPRSSDSGIQSIKVSKSAVSSVSNLKLYRKTDSITVYGEGLKETNTEQLKHVAFQRAWERKGRAGVWGGGRTCQDLRCLLKTLVSARESVPSSKMSSRSTDVTPLVPSEPETKSAPIRALAPPRTRHFRWCSSHFVSRQRIPRAA